MLKGIYWNMAKLSCLAKKSHGTAKRALAKKKMNVVLIAQLPEGFLQTEGNSVVRNQNWFRDKLGRNTEVCAQKGKYNF